MTCAPLCDLVLFVFGVDGDAAEEAAATNLRRLHPVVLEAVRAADVAAAVGEEVASVFAHFPGPGRAWLRVSGERCLQVLL